MAIDFDKVALEYAKKINWDGATRCGERNGYIYYSLYAEKFIGKKIGQPAIIKIGSSGTIINIEQIEEIMWAINQLNQQ